jgi:hypothetical protein
MPQRRGAVKETDHRDVLVATEKKRNFVLIPLVGVYLLSMLITLSHLGEPVPYFGKEYTGDAAESIVFVNSVVSLYLIFGILKRQRLTFWLLMVCNFIHSFNGMANLLLLPVQHIHTVGGLVPDYDYRLTSFWVFLLFMLLNVFLYFNRHHFDNKSVYLW